MKVEYREKIYILDCDGKVIQWAEENLIIPNPEFLKKQRLGKWTGDTPKFLCLYEKFGNYLWLPFGCLRKVWGMLRGSECNICFPNMRKFDYGSTMELYPYQERAVREALQKKNGVLVMPCGSGKTQCGLEIINRIGGKALWLTHTTDLLNQSKARVENVLVNVGAGTITGGKVNAGAGITFATVQTMSKLDLVQYKDEWDIVIVDECHHCAGTPTRVSQFYKVLSHLNARYKFGLTATPKRADGLERAMYALLGDIICEVTKDDVAETTCPIKVMEVETGYVPDYRLVLMGDGTLDYVALANTLVTDRNRFSKVVDVLRDLQGKPTIVLANRVEYLRRLWEEVEGGVCLSGGDLKRKARKAALSDLNEGRLNYVFATYQLAKEGLDVPNLRYIVLATPEKDASTITQAVGRVGRAADGKDFGMVIDFVDEFGMYRGWQKKRRAIYKKLGAEILDTD